MEHRNQVDEPVCGVVALSIQSVRTNHKQVTSIPALQRPQVFAPDSDSRYRFAPGWEALQIEW